MTSSTSNVITFPRHKLKRCDCGDGACQYCGGGLAYCTTCCGFEGAMPEDCPQVRMTNEQADLVYQGKIDYRLKHGGWTEWTREREFAVRRLL
jgi:hypothetical protein